MNPFVLAEQPEFRQSVMLAVNRGLSGLDDDLAAMPADGAQMAYTVKVVRRPTGESRVIVYPTVKSVVETDANTDAYLTHLAKQQCDMSVRLPLSSRLIIAAGQSVDGESAHIGSATLPVDIDGTYSVAVGCAGPHELLCEAYANKICAEIAAVFISALLRTDADMATA